MLAGLAWLLSILAAQVIGDNSDLVNSDNWEWAAEPLVEPHQTSENSTKSIETPEDDVEGTVSSLLFSSRELSDYANSSLEPIRRILSNPAEFIILQFSSTVIVTNLANGAEYTVSELHSVDQEMSKLTVKDPQHNATSTCSFHTGGFGHATTGIRCRTSRNYPEECFCWDKVCRHPYLPVHKIFLKFTSHGGEFKESFPGLFSWSIEKSDLKLNATFKVIRNKFLYPLEIFVEGFGYAIGSKQDTAKLKYSVLLFYALSYRFCG